MNNQRLIVLPTGEEARASQRARRQERQKTEGTGCHSDVFFGGDIKKKKGQLS